MAGFKEAGQFSEVQVPSEYINGGVNLAKGYSVRHPNFRLRPESQAETEKGVSAHDLDPIRLYPDELRGLSLPEDLTSVNVGMELEFTVINPNGDLADLYGGDQIQKNNGRVEIFSTGNPWAIDELGGSPECLRHQVELNAPKGTNAIDVVKAAFTDQKALIEKAAAKGLLLLPTGLSGLKLNQGWENVPPHPYVMKIHKICLGPGGQTFDGMSIQHHVDLAPYGGSLEHALFVGNQYNNLLASMIAGISTSSPFWKGHVTGLYSNREHARHTLATRGGIQATDYPLNGTIFIQNADRLIRAGVIPVPERGGNYLDRVGNGSHRDYRPKISLGTGEFGSGDMNPNPLLQVAEAVVLRKFVEKTTEHLIQQEPLPKFQGSILPKDRIHNRKTICKYGNNAVLRTATGEMHISEVWRNMFEWLWKESTTGDQEATLAQTAVEMALDVRHPRYTGQDAIANFFNRSGPAFLRGNFSAVMLEYAHSIPGSDNSKIKKTNLEAALRYRDFILETNTDHIF